MFNGDYTAFKEKLLKEGASRKEYTISKGNFVSKALARFVRKKSSGLTASFVRVLSVLT